MKRCELCAQCPKCCRCEYGEFEDGMPYCKCQGFGPGPIIAPDQSLEEFCDLYGKFS